MRNTLKTVALFFAFLIGGILFQISCSNSDENSLAATQINKILFVKGAGEMQTIWSCDYDGSNLIQIPVTLPANVVLNSINGNAYPRLSPDGQKVFFVTFNITTSESAIYSCDITGNNLLEVYNGGTSTTTNHVLGLGSVN